MPGARSRLCDGEHERYFRATDQIGAISRAPVAERVYVIGVGGNRVASPSARVYP